MTLRDVAWNGVTWHGKQLNRPETMAEVDEILGLAPEEQREKVGITTDSLVDIGAMTPPQKRRFGSKLVCLAPKKLFLPTTLCAPQPFCAIDVLGMCLACAWHVLGMCLACTWHVLGMYLACGCHVLAI
jgi:hypothetical protein